MKPEAWSGHLYEVIENTWPARSQTAVDGWIIRDGDGGGQRVSAATQEKPGARIEKAEHEMAALGQHPLFMVRDGEDELDRRLEERGYRIKDPVNLYVRDLADWPEGSSQNVQSLIGWEPLGIMREIWNEGGIDAARIRVMKRAKSPKTAVLARHGQRPAGVAFVSVWKETAMVHAIEVSHEHRRHGVGTHILWRSAHWAQNNGATRLAVVVAKANTGANNLYSALGMSPVGAYHYRIGQ